MAGVVHVPWYATVAHSDELAEGVSAIAAVALRYGATQYAVHRSRDDRYKVLQMAWFESKPDWYRYWDGREMIEFRAAYGSRYQIPVVYVWHDELIVGEIVTADDPLPVA